MQLAGCALELGTPVQDPWSLVEGGPPGTGTRWHASCMDAIAGPHQGPRANSHCASHNVPRETSIIMELGGLLCIAAWPLGHRAWL